MASFDAVPYTDYLKSCTCTWTPLGWHWSCGVFSDWKGEGGSYSGSGKQPTTGPHLHSIALQLESLCEATHGSKLISTRDGLPGNILGKPAQGMCVRWLRHHESLQYSSMHFPSTLVVLLSLHVWGPQHDGRLGRPVNTLSKRWQAAATHHLLLSAPWRQHRGDGENQGEKWVRKGGQRLTKGSLYG